MRKSTSFLVGIGAFLLLGLPSLAQAGEGSSVGGGGVFCRAKDGTITSAEIFDFFEGRVLRGIVHELGAPSLSVGDKIRYVVHRLLKLDSARARRYEERAAHIEDEIRFIDSSLIPVSDLGDIVLDPDCAIEQIAVRHKPEFPEDKLFLISRRRWEALDNDNKAGLLLHEMVYEEAVRNGYHDSKVARYFNSLITSALIDSFSQDKYDSLVHQQLLLGDDQWFYAKSGRLNIVLFPGIQATMNDAAQYCESRGMALEAPEATDTDTGFLNSHLAKRLEKGKEFWADQWEHTERITDTGFEYHDHQSPALQLPFFCRESR